MSDSNKERIAVYERLVRLTETQLDEVIIRSGVPLRLMSSPDSPSATRATEIIGYFESLAETDYSTLTAALDEVCGDQAPPLAGPNPWWRSPAGIGGLVAIALIVGAVATALLMSFKPLGQDKQPSAPALASKADTSKRNPKTKPQPSSPAPQKTPTRKSSKKRPSKPQDADTKAPSAAQTPTLQDVVFPISDPANPVPLKPDNVEGKSSEAAAFDEDRRTAWSVPSGAAQLEVAWDTPQRIFEIEVGLTHYALFDEVRVGVQRPDGTVVYPLDWRFTEAVEAEGFILGSPERRGLIGKRFHLSFKSAANRPLNFAEIVFYGAPPTRP